MRLNQIAVCALILALLGCGGSRRSSGFSDRSRGVVQFGVQAANILDEQKRNRLWVIVDVPYRSLMFERQKGKFISRFEVTVALRDDNDHAVELFDDSGSIEVASYDRTQPDSLYARIARFLDAPPGEYRLEAVLTDRVSKGTGYFSKPVRIRDLDSKELTLSDILLLQEEPNGFPSSDQILPAYKMRFSEKFYAFAQARNVKSGSALRASLTAGQSSTTTVGTIAAVDSSSDNEVTNVLFPIPPTALGLGRLLLKIEVDDEPEPVSVSRSILVRWATRPTSAAALDNYVAPMRLVMDGKRWKELRDAPPQQQREIIAEFWESRNPNEDSEANLLEEEFYWRVGEANARFSWGKRTGWDTDRGRIYIVHGPPQNVGRRQDQLGRAIEIWRYEDPTREFVFYDDHGDGRFRLYRQSYSS